MFYRSFKNESADFLLWKKYEKIEICFILRYTVKEVTVSKIMMKHASYAEKKISGNIFTNRHRCDKYGFCRKCERAKRIYGACSYRVLNTR